MANFEAESFDLRKVLTSTVDAYRDVYAERTFSLACSAPSVLTKGSPELLIQMLDKLVDNAVEFSASGDTIVIGLDLTPKDIVLSVANPGPSLPERMRSQLFDSMVSVRETEGSRHLGLGLYVARLIAEGHGGHIAADNVEGGVRFEVRLPALA